MEEEDKSVWPFETEICNGTEEVVKFTHQNVLAYLDLCIRNARKRRDANSKGTEENLMAVGAVDAFQSVRTSLFGELLPKEG